MRSVDFKYPNKSKITIRSTVAGHLTQSLAYPLSYPVYYYSVLYYWSALLECANPKSNTKPDEGLFWMFLYVSLYQSRPHLVL